MEKLNLGCGRRIKKGFVNADFNPNLKGVDIMVDINKLPMKIFRDNQFDFILMESILEYADCPIKLMEEIHRIGKNKTNVHITVPYHNSTIGFPYKKFDCNFFKHFFLEKQNLHYASCYYKVKSIKVIPTFWGKFIPDIPFPKYLGLRHFISSFLGNIIKQIEFKAEIIKK
ncbi:class I SAM-dependent methyltransferase [Candidatus Woesearchaeota archaeon]|nr:class I SAM-dependent methyltransferase [Candidatus Woesearchaeota archaeon]